MSLAHVLVVVLLVPIVALVDAVVGQVHVAVAQSLCGVRVSEAGLHQLETTKQFLLTLVSQYHASAITITVYFVVILSKVFVQVC